MVSKLRENKVLDGLVLYGTVFIVGILIYFLLRGVLFPSIGLIAGTIVMMVLSFAFGFLFTLYYMKKVHLKENTGEEDVEEDKENI